MSRPTPGYKREIVDSSGFCYSVLDLADDWKTTKLNEPERQKTGKRDSYQQAKHAKLSSDLLPDKRRETFDSSGFSTEGGP